MNTWESLSLSMDAQMFALQVAISGGGVSGLVLLAARLLRHRSAPLRYGVLLAGVFGLLASPALVGVGLNVPLLPAGEEFIKVTAEMLPAFLDRPVMEEPPVAEASSSIGDIVGTPLLIVWAGFAILGLVRLLFGLWKQRRAIVGQPWNAAWWTDERRNCLAEKVGLRRFPPVHCSPVAPMPMVVGLLRPKIVLPESSPSTWGESQWEAVLLHEAAHIARRDPWAAFAQCLAVILFWWCPLVHLMARRLNDLRESICDDYALEGPCDRLAYAELLVESAERLVNLRALPVVIGLIDSARGGLEERITRLLAKEKEPMKKLSLAGKLLGASFLVAACLSITAATAFTQTPPAKKIQIKIVVDGKEIDLDAANLGALLQAAQAKPEAAPKFKIAIDPSELKFKVHVEGGQRVTLPAADPRIEELVKQAEAIKPGSGTDVRRALEAKPKTANFYGVAPATPYSMVPPAPAKGQHVIVVTIDAATGRVMQVSGVDSKKAPGNFGTGHGIEFRLATKPADPAAPQGDKHLVDAAMKAIEAYKKATDEETRVKAAQGLKALGATKPAPLPSPALPGVAPVPVKPPVPGAAPKLLMTRPAVPDIEALARQLERINAELQELRKRLDAKKE